MDETAYRGIQEIRAIDFRLPVVDCRFEDIRNYCGLRRKTNLIFTLKTQLAIHLFLKSLIFRLKIVVVITCHWFSCMSNEWQVSFYAENDTCPLLPLVLCVSGKGQVTQVNVVLLL
jgi:hypothetical protein